MPPPTHSSTSSTASTPPPNNPSSHHHFPPTKSRATTAHNIATSTLTTWTWPPQAPLPPNRTTASTPYHPRLSDSPSPSPPPTPNPYKYDSPDSIPSASPPSSPGPRKRKRHQRLCDEMAWNSGLDTWVRRRDAWTGAVDAPPAEPLTPATPTTPTRPSSQTVITPTSPKHSSNQPTTTTTTMTPNPYNPPLVPHPIPLLPATNPTRAAITPRTYPSIYSKIVLQGLTPSVPINLSDLTRAIVEGWKEEGAWPPPPGGRSAEPDVVVGGGKRKEGGLARRGVGKVRRVLGLRGEGVGG
ncbi:hypothetical protein MMC12_005801 [Toensbergia leucococca]|nr:hypothetical protein [Toensbergia leucococca]